MSGLFVIKSPSGKFVPVSAESIYHAIQKAILEESFAYEAKEYFKLNSKMVKKSNR